LIALGMILPLPIKVFIEVSLDPTNHNLLGVEVLICWLPAFTLALAGASIGSTFKHHKIVVNYKF